jgi:hypothetical protein
VTVRPEFRSEEPPVSSSPLSAGGSLLTRTVRLTAAWTRWSCTNTRTCAHAH